VADVWRRAGLEPRTLTRLAEADAFAALGLSRREALWAARALVPKGELPLFAGDLDGEGIVEGAVVLPQMTEGEQVVEDYVAMRLTLRSHPVALNPNFARRWPTIFMIRTSSSLIPASLSAWPACRIM
jgi:DNA polymerase III alpha subunit